MAELAIYDNDPTLYLFTSLTAGSSHIVTATSRIETILKANKIPFKGVDTATDELARKLFQRRAHGKKLPLLVKEGYVLGDLEQIEEWNEYDEIKEALGFSSAPVKPAVLNTTSTPSTTTTATTSAPTTKAEPKQDTPATPSSEQNLAIRQLGAEAAKIAAAKKPVPTNISTTNPLLTEKINSPLPSAGATPKKLDTPDAASGILSPRNVPLPATPGPGPGTPSAGAGAGVGVGAPHRPSLASMSSASSQGSRMSFHGADVEEASPEEIRRVEEEEAIAEVSSSEEEDSEDEREREKSKSVSRSPPVVGVKDEGAVGGTVEGKAGVEKSVAPDPATTAKVETKSEEESEEDSEEDEGESEDEEDESEEEDEKTQKQSAKAPEKAGTSVQD